MSDNLLCVSTHNNTLRFAGIKLLEILQTKLGLLVGSASDFIIDKEDEIETETKFQSYIQHVMKTVQCDKEFLEEECKYYQRIFHKNNWLNIFLFA